VYEETIVETTCPLPHTPDTLSGQFNNLNSITRYCTATEISTFLRSLNANLTHDRESMAEWSAKASELDRAIDRADSHELRDIHDDLNRIEMERFLLTSSVSSLHQSCTHYRDVLAKRAMILVAAEMEAAGRPLPSIPFALVSMGSDGREEQTLITDQDYLIVYGDGGGEAADYYFLDYSNLLVDRLEEAGFQRCTGGIMPSNQTWRGSLSQWRKRLLSIVRYEVEDYAKNMMDLIVLSDARYVAGDRSLANELVTMIRDMERDYSRVLWGMAKAATEMKLALGFLKRLWTESSGEHKGEFNLKLLAWAPLVMNVRILSINQSIPVRPRTPLSVSVCLKRKAVFHLPWPVTCEAPTIFLPNTASCCRSRPSKASRRTHTISIPTNCRPMNVSAFATLLSGSRICRKSFTPTFQLCSP